MVNNNDSVVVTGIGLVSPIGNSKENFWDAVSCGKPPYKPEDKCYRVEEDCRESDRFIKFALSAAINAVNDAGLTGEMLKKAAVTVSSSKGGIGFIDKSSGWLFPNMAARTCAEYFGVAGPSINVISACATGLNSIIIGANLIKTKRAKLVLCGGTDACLSEFVIAAYNNLGVLAKDYCRPYDKKRSGFKLSEGASVVILEEKLHAYNRSAKIYGEITGHASLGEGYHITSLDPAAETIKEVIDLTCSDKDKIDYINTHGTGTIGNDITETLALKKAFGESVYNIPMSSSKAITGHMLGASGAIEFVVGLLAMSKNFVPPTANLKIPDPLCNLDYTPCVGRKHNINRFLTLSYGFGGHVCGIEVTKL